MASLHALVTSLRPLLMKSRAHPYAIYFKGVDFMATPLYEITYLFQVICTWIGVVLFIPFCSFLFQSVLFATAMMKILKDRFRTIADPFNSGLRIVPNGSLINSRFRLYIEFHKRIIRFVDDLSRNVSTVFFVEIIIFGILLCALLFVVQVVAWNEAVVAAIQTLLIIIQLFILYYFANELIEKVRENLMFELFLTCFS